ncbi:hypothetical protein ABEF95_014886 [Exophiala dermatitidis]
MSLNDLHKKKLAANEAMKRKFERDCQRSLPNFEVRMILENKFATDSVFISARHCNIMEKIFDAVRDKLPLVPCQQIMGIDFCAPVFLLQETSKQLPELRTTKWVKVRWGRGLLFNRWYRRNLRDSDLKIEIHLRTDECITRAPSTNEWFPERKVRAKPESSPQPKRRRIMETSAETSAGEGKEKAEGDKEKAEEGKEKAVGEKKKAEEDKGEGEEAGRGKVVVAEEEKTVSTT